jgi:hypothetical protein
MNLSPHFTLEELTASETADRQGIDNTPTDVKVMNHLKFLAHNLEDVRECLGSPIHINSGYRSLVVNALLGSKPTSAHVKGLAADFVCPSFGTPKEIVKRLSSSNVAYDQLILEFNRWVHIAFSEEGYIPRKQVLIIDKSGTRQFN